MTTSPDLRRLADPFPPEDVDWLPGVTTKDKTKALAFPYVKNAAIMDRLDAVCGPENWCNAFKSGPDGGVLCGISIRVTYADGTAEWVTKWDGAENTDVEAVKGGLSSAQKRASTQWGIARYFSRIPQQWVRLDKRGRFVETPRIPAPFLPKGHQQASSVAPMASSGDGGAHSTPPTPRAGERRIVRTSEANGTGRREPPQR